VHRLELNAEVHDKIQITCTLFHGPRGASGLAFGSTPVRYDFPIESRFLGFDYRSSSSVLRSWTFVIPFWFLYALTAGCAGLCIYRYKWRHH
jgi:hypothetical protein